MRPLPSDWPRSRGWILIWRLGGAVCHQRPDRSFRIRGRQMPVCARCTGIYSSFFVSIVAGAVIAPDMPFILLAAILFLGQLPMLADGLTQYKGMRESTNMIRLLTGVLSGGSLGFLIGLTLAGMVSG